MLSLQDPSGARLTHRIKPARFPSVNQTTFLGLSAPDFDALAAEASELALREAVAAGVPVTWMIEGQLVTLQPDDPRLDPYRDGRPDAKAA